VLVPAGFSGARARSGPQLFRTARKRNASVWGMSQTAEILWGRIEAETARGGHREELDHQDLGQQPET